MDFTKKSIGTCGIDQENNVIYSWLMIAIRFFSWLNLCWLIITFQADVSNYQRTGGITSQSIMASWICVARTWDPSDLSIIFSIKQKGRKMAPLVA